jgi:hypothetical protein
MGQDQGRLPQVVEVEQQLYARRAGDIPAAVARACREAGLARGIEGGERVAITVGSRGIDEISRITRSAADAVKAAGGRPFIIPAMGSHGGATAAGQAAVLASLGVTAGSVGAPVRASMATDRVGRTRSGTPVYVSREALRADGVIVVNRVKQHTDFAGAYESGLVKMLAIGLGKRDGAAAMHSRGCGGLREDVPEAARIILKRVPVIGGLAILENGYHQTAEIVGLKPEEILPREPALLRRVKRRAARLPFAEIDLLILDWIGKDISGIGMDTRVVGRRMIWEEPEFRGPRVRLIAALDLTPGSHGNALGIGLADMTTERLVKKIDWEALKANVLHTGWLNRAKLPLAFPNDQALLRAALAAVSNPERRRVRMVRLKDTLHLGRFWISEGLLPEARDNRRIRVLGRPQGMRFDRTGNLR